MRKIYVLAAIAVLAAGPTTVGAAGPAYRTTHMGMGVSTVTVTRVAGRYRLTLTIGPTEKMYSQAEYRRLHPKTGEVMLRGAMVMGGMSGMSAPNRHLELHVFDLHTKAYVANAACKISYQQTSSTGGMSGGMSNMSSGPQDVPIAVMIGIGTGMSDVHYGNNVFMAAGSYHVWAQVNRVKVVFPVHLT